MLTHFTTLRGAVMELDGHGFDVEAVFARESARPHPAGEPLTGMYLHLIARARE